MVADIEPWQAAVSLVLVFIVVGVSAWRRLGLERSILWASLRAAVQLIAVGVFFTVIFESSLALVWAWLWVAAMVLISGWVVTRRASSVPGLFAIGIASIGLTCSVVLLVLFGFGVLDAEPVAIVVIAGITIGNTMPATVQAVDRTRSGLIDERGQIEAMLALGFPSVGATQPLVREVTKLALTPQIERTRVVGLIALPGAMTGLLLAGADPLDAVLIQLVVMFLVLGSVAVSVTIVTIGMSRQALTPDLRLADWVQRSPD